MSGAEELDKLISIDEQNLGTTLRWMSAQGPEYRTAVDDAADLYSTLARAYSQGARNDEDQRAHQEAAERLGLTDEEIARLVDSPGDASPAQLPHITAIQEAQHRMWSRYIRGVLLLQLGRSYLWGLTDYLRLRLTPMFAQMRHQAETVATAAMLCDEPEVTVGWFELRPGSKESKSFFSRTSEKRRALLRRFELSQTYDFASGVALHPSGAGIVPSFSMSEFSQGDRAGHEIRLRFQEINTGEPAEMLHNLLYFLRTQQRVFSATPEVFPEISDKLLIDTRIPRFRAEVDALWMKFTHEHPDFVRRTRPPDDGVGG